MQTRPMHNVHLRPPFAAADSTSPRPSTQHASPNTPGARSPGLPSALEARRHRWLTQPASRAQRRERGEQPPPAAHAPPHMPFCAVLSPVDSTPSRTAHTFITLSAGALFAVALLSLYGSCSLSIPSRVGIRHMMLDVPHPGTSDGEGLHTSHVTSTRHKIPGSHEHERQRRTHAVDAYTRGRASARVVSCLPGAGSHDSTELSRSAQISKRAAAIPGKANAKPMTTHLQQHPRIMNYSGMAPLSRTLLTPVEATKVDMSEYFQANWYPRTEDGADCAQMRRLGPRGGGGKMLCLDVIPRPEEPCRVVSVDTGSNFGFEIALHERYPRCEIDVRCFRAEQSSTPPLYPTLHPQPRTPRSSTHTHIQHLPNSLMGGRQVYDGASFGREPVRHVPSFISFHPLNFRSRTWARFSGLRVDLLKINCEGCEFAAVPPFVQHVCPEQLMIDVHGTSNSGSDRHRQVQVLLTTLNRTHAIFYREPSMQHTDSTCIGFAMRRRDGACPELVHLRRSEALEVAGAASGSDAGLRAAAAEVEEEEKIRLAEEEIIEDAPLIPSSSNGAKRPSREEKRLEILSRRANRSKARLDATESQSAAVASYVASNAMSPKEIQRATLAFARYTAVRAKLQETGGKRRRRRRR